MDVPPSANDWPWTDELDAPIAAPDSHRLLFENDRVRVLEVVIAAGAREPEHTHGWPSVMIVDEPPDLARGSHKAPVTESRIPRALRDWPRRLEDARADTDAGAGRPASRCSHAGAPRLYGSPLGDHASKASSAIKAPAAPSSRPAHTTATFPRVTQLRLAHAAVTPAPRNKHDVRLGRASVCRSRTPAPTPAPSPPIPAPSTKASVGPP